MQVAVDRFSKFPRAKLYRSISNNQIQKFVEDYIINQWGNWNIKFDQARSFIGTNIKKFAEKHIK